MRSDEFDFMLRDSAFLRQSLVDLQRAAEEAMAILAAAVSGQIDAPTLESDLRERQQRSALDAPNPTRDRFLNSMRERLRT